MSDHDLPGADTPVGGPRANPLYAAVWRWHFYAGLYVVPFLLMLTITGFFMMWFTTIMPEKGDRLAVLPLTETQPLPDLEKAAMAAVPGGQSISQYIVPIGPETPALFYVVAAEAGTYVVAIDPYRGDVLRVTRDGDTWAALAEKIHGTLLIGTLGDRLIEAAASLGVMLVASGIYLWWPRSKGAVRALLVPRLAARGRAFWKTIHAVTGAWTAILLTLFLLTGLAWTGIWGEKYVQAWSTFPAAKFDNVPLSDATHAKMNHAQKEVPWVLEQTPMPASGSDAGVTGLAMGTPVTFETLVHLGQAIGFRGRFHVKAPKDANGVWSLTQESMSYDSSSPTIDRTVHVDRFTGKILADVRFADYGLAGKAMAVGIALHEGQTGLWNVVLNGVFCLAIVILCLSGMVMWWLRRPAHAARLAAPPLPAHVPMARGVMLTALLLSMALPMLGLTLLAVLAADLVVLSALPGLKRVLS